MKRRIRLTESDLHRVIKESVKKVLSENRLSKKYLRESWSDENEEEYGDWRYVGRTSFYYGDSDIDGESLYEEPTWTYSDNINDEEFAGEVYELTPYDSKELDYWLKNIPAFNNFMYSSYEEDRILALILMNKLEEDESYRTKETYEEINACLEDTWISSEVNGSRWSAYFLNLQNIKRR
jgi:hypothetical protein